MDRRRKSGLTGPARLRIPAFRSGAQTEASGRCLTIERHGHRRAVTLVRDEATGEQVARLRRERRRLLLELDGRVAEGKRLGRREGFGFVAESGEPFIRASDEARLAEGTAELDGLVAALLAFHLLIRKHEAAAGAAEP